ncbi:hypothetical protein [Microcoleus sp.]|uniref:hypothetical protein n=1 Tax=Microcoleus sp. TaxID=44472 RepID=UPI0035935BAB
MTGFFGWWGKESRHGPKEETAVPFPYPKIIVGKRHCRVLRSLRITTQESRHGPKEETAVPFPYPKIIVGTRHCRFLRCLRITTQETGFFSGFCDFNEIFSQKPGFWPPTHHNQRNRVFMGF